MAGEGAMMSTIHSLKNNSRRGNREPFSHISGISDKESLGIKTRPISQEALKTIKTKVKRQQKQLLIKRSLISTLLIFILTLIFCILLSQSNF